MSDFTCKIKDSKGTNRFIAPLVTVTDKTGKKTVSVNSQAGLALQLSYVVMAMGEDSNVYSDKTKREAGTLVTDFIKSLPAESIVTFYHPISDADVNNFDVKLWTPIVSATRESLVKVAESLAKVDSIFQSMQADIDSAVKLSEGLTATNLNPLPVYYAGEESSKRAKSGGGKKFTPITL